MKEIKMIGMEEYYFYIIDIFIYGKTFVGFGITGNLDNRITTHINNLYNSGGYIGDITAYRGERHMVEIVEKSIKNYINFDECIPVIGFVEESTSIEKKDIIANFIKKHLSKIEFEFKMKPNRIKKISEEISIKRKKAKNLRQKINRATRQNKYCENIKEDLVKIKNEIRMLMEIENIGDRNLFMHLNKLDRKIKEIEEDNETIRKKNKYLIYNSRYNVVSELLERANRNRDGVLKFKNEILDSLNIMGVDICTSEKKLKEVYIENVDACNVDELDNEFKMIAKANRLILNFIKDNK